MNRDTYARFLRSETYKELLMGGKKKVISREIESWIFSSSPFRRRSCYSHPILFLALQKILIYIYMYKYTHTQDKEKHHHLSLINEHIYS